MNNLKEKLANTFEKIQYESEDLVASLQSRVDNSEMGNNFLKLKNATSRKIGVTLSKIEKEMRQLKDVYEIDAYLDETKERFETFMSDVRTKANEVENGIDVSEFIGKLNDETGDMIHKVSKVVMEKAKEVKLDEKLSKFTEKSTSIYQDVKDKGLEVMDDLKGKTEELTKEVSEKSKEVTDKLKDKLGS